MGLFVWVLWRIIQTPVCQSSYARRINSLWIFFSAQRLQRCNRAYCDKRNSAPFVLQVWLMNTVSWDSQWECFASAFFFLRNGTFCKTRHNFCHRKSFDMDTFASPLFIFPSSSQFQLARLRTWHLWFCAVRQGGHWAKCEMSRSAEG